MYVFMMSMGCFFWGDDRQDNWLIETGFIFPFPNHRDSESAAPESDCISSGMEALVSCGSWTLDKPMLGWMGMENDGKGWKVWQFQAFYSQHQWHHHWHWYHQSWPRTRIQEPEPPTPSSSSMIARICIYIYIGFLFLMFLNHRLHWLSLCCTTTATPDVWNDGSSTLKDVDCTKHMSLVKPNSRHLLLQIDRSQQPFFVIWDNGETAFDRWSPITSNKTLVFFNSMAIRPDIEKRNKFEYLFNICWLRTYICAFKHVYPRKLP